MACENVQMDNYFWDFLNKRASSCYWSTSWMGVCLVLTGGTAKSIMSVIQLTSVQSVGDMPGVEYVVTIPGLQDCMLSPMND